MADLTSGRFNFPPDLTQDRFDVSPDLLAAVQDVEVHVGDVHAEDVEDVAVAMVQIAVAASRSDRTAVGPPIRPRFSRIQDRFTLFIRDSIWVAGP